MVGGVGGMKSKGYYYGASVQVQIPCNMYLSDDVLVESSFLVNNTRNIKN